MPDVVRPARSSRWDAWAQLDRRVWQMAIARAVNTMGLSLVMAFLGVYIVESRHYPAWLYGVIALISNLGQCMANAVAGGLSARAGRRPAITGSLPVRSVVSPAARVPVPPPPLTRPLQRSRARKTSACCCRTPF